MSLNKIKKNIISLLTLMLADCIVILISFSIAYFIRSQILPSIFFSIKNIPLFPLSMFLYKYYFLSVWILVFAYEKLYIKRFPFWQETKVLIKSATLSSILITIIIFLTKTQVQFSRIIVVLAWMISLVLFPLSRYLTKILLMKLNIWRKKLLIIGVNNTSLQIMHNIKHNRSMGFDIQGFIDYNPTSTGKVYNGTEVLGSIEDLENIASTLDSKDIMISTPHIPRNQLKILMEQCENTRESMWVIPRSGDFITEGVEIDVVGDVLTLYIKKNLIKPWNILLKTSFELALTIVFTLLLLPLFLIIAIAIKLDSKGPALFIQPRVVKGNRLYNVYKFRSMFINSEKKFKDYLKTHPEDEDEWNKFKKLKKNDPRVTRVGKFIRKYSLDELPQLFNILKGNMSLVGPRPYLPHELSNNDSFKNNIAKVKPGITGLWQISGRSEVPFEQRLLYDEQYIRNWSLWLDITILLRSIKVIFSSKGAY